MTKKELPTSVWLADDKMNVLFTNPDTISNISDKKYTEYIHKVVVDGMLLTEHEKNLDLKKKLDSLWQDAQGDNLPPIDKEVIVLTSSFKNVI